MNTDRLAKVDWISDECKRKLNDAIEWLGPNFEELTRSFLLNLEPLLESSSGFKIRLVVDTNAILSESISLMKGGNPFLLALIQSPFLEIIAPPDIIQELRKIIPKRIPNMVEREKVIEISQKVLAGIKILQSSSFSRIKAEAMMAGKDPKDVSFIQIAIELNTHGVLTRDPHFEDFSEVKKWELGEVGRILTEVNRGALSLWIVGVGIPGSAFILLQILMALIGMAVQNTANIGSSLLEGGKSLVNWIVEGAKQHPEIALASVGLSAAIFLGLLSWDPSREWIIEQMKKVEQFGRSLVSTTFRLISDISNSINPLIDACSEKLPILLEWAECLSYSSVLLFKRVEELDQL